MAYGAAVEQAEKHVFRLAKARRRASLDVTEVRAVKNEDGEVLRDAVAVKERWRAYFEQLLNEEFPRKERNSAEPVAGPIQPWTVDEVRMAMKKMKAGKASGPDGIPVEAWRSLGELGVRWLTMFFNNITRSEKIPEAWKDSIIVPIFKRKGDAMNCANYRDSRAELQLKIQKWQSALADAGLKLNLRKTEIMSSLGGDDVVLDANGTAFTQAEQFQYLGSILSADGTVDAAVRGRIACAWLKWREATGILCDRRCSRVLKGKIYRTVVRPAMMYGSECWPVTKAHERMLNTAEMRMLRWACGLTRRDKMSKAFIGKPAPDFATKAVFDGDFVDVKLSDYKGKYVVLFFYPLDL
ncbi:hypothetical protein Y032_0142g2346 [Ancylostoma ceylanicum]|uniref:Alkyl hydroperoxide reductase subunit C/ Thiol specific antioxidant domain-containing protein n=1 Tax=Ancylostoma ceylanicum TaxID=53326 RepID=A0A016T3J4_9BILA|nr:hypothetical protein Y032_0142g2346 [Ancylostoma ceylanicum]